MSGLLRLCKVADLATGCIRRVDVEGMPVLAVFNVDGTYYATNDTCTHGKASLSEGALEGDVVECPWHGGRFHVPSGRPVSLPASEPVQVYPVIVVGEDLCLRRPEDAD